jgi:hypothetical protein
MKNTKLPPHILMEEEMTLGQLFAPIDTDGLVGGGCKGVANRPYTQAEILTSLLAPDRSKFKKGVSEGFRPVLMIDLETGVAAMEMRKWEKPFVPKATAAQLKLRKLWSAVYDSECRLKASIIALNDAQRLTRAKSRQKASGRIGRCLPMPGPAKAGLQRNATA